jgi:hypothetical protein
MEYIYINDDLEKLFEFILTYTCNLFNKVS